MLQFIICSNASEMDVAIVQRKINESEHQLTHARYPLSRETLINLDKWEVQAGRIRRKHLSPLSLLGVNKP